MFEALGRSLLKSFSAPLMMSTMFCDALKTAWTERGKSDKLVWNVIFQQILFTGVEAMKVVTIIALLLGFVTIIQTVTQLPKVGGEALIGKMLVLVVVRELGPMLTAFIIIGRSGTAIAIEIGNMIVNHEIEAIEMMGINPLRFIVLPRLIGVTIAVACLSLYFTIVALFGGFLFSKFFTFYPFPVFLDHLGSAFGVWDLTVNIMKCTLFGVIVAAICCYRGFTVKFSSTEVPQVTTKAVVGSIYVCFLINAVITAFFYI